MATPQNKCPNCSAPVSYGTVHFGLFPPRVTCPQCASPLSGLSFIRMPSLPFLYVSLGLGLAVGIGVGFAITVLSRDWSYTYRFIVLASTVLGGVLFVGLSRRVVSGQRDGG